MLKYFLVEVDYFLRGLVKWYNNGLQNHCWEFDSLIPCHYEFLKQQNVAFSFIYMDFTVFITGTIIYKKYYNALFSN